MNGPPDPSLDVFLADQERRVHALLLVHALWPTATTVGALQVARWITTGRWDA